MKIPTIHLNGTSGEALVEQYQDAVVAVCNAIDAMCDAGPNARDYYPQGPDAALEAQREHEDRVKSLKAVRDQLFAIREGIQEQLDARDAQRRARS